MLQQKMTITELDFEKDLILEGITVDSHSKKIYLNNLKSNR